MCAAVALLCAGCGSQHAMLQSPSTTPGQRFSCNQARGCEPAEVDVPTRDSVPGVVFVALPDACDGRFHQLVIYNADTSNPEVGVTCALK
jgi:hypothetical protein